MLQYGLYELNQPKEKRDDWVYILDHTIEFGTKKCLLILGTTLEHMNNKSIQLEHKDVCVLKLVIQEDSSSEEVKKILDELVNETGTPRQIISDHGNNIKKAVESICIKHPGISYNYDITHKCALILKHLLENDERWKEFVQEYAKSKRKCVHTLLAYIAPSKTKEKSRWLNLDIYINWFRKAVLYRDNIDIKLKNAKNKEEKIKKFNELFPWIGDFESEHKYWKDIMSILGKAQKVVKKNGLRHNTAQLFLKAVGKLNIDKNKCCSVINEMYVFFKDQTKNITKNITLLGTTDIIESVFGKYKNFSARTPMKDLGKTILAIPAFVGEITLEKIKEAFSKIKNSDLQKWLKENIGVTLFSRRKEAFKPI